MKDKGQKRKLEDSFVLRYVDEPVHLVNDSSAPMSREGLGFHMFRAKDPKKKRQRIIAAESGRIQFEGRNFGDQAGCSPLTNWVVGVPLEERAEDGSRIIEIRDATVFGLTSTILGLDTEEMLARKSDRGFEARNALGEAFGTVKLKQAIKATARNIVEVDQLKPMSGMIQHAIDQKTKDLPTVEELNSGDLQDRSIPPFDLAAKSAEHIYPFDSVITPAEQEEVPYKNLMMLEPSGLDEVGQREEFGSFVMKHLTSQANKKKKDKRTLLILMYITYLIRLKYANKRDLSDEAALAYTLDAPSIVQERLLNLFTESFGQEDKPRRAFSPKGVDKLYSYILVLCLYIEDFQLDTTEISADLQLNKTKLNQLLKNLGCTISQEGKKTIAKLKAPLSFPKPRLGNRY